MNKKKYYLLLFFFFFHILLIKATNPPPNLKATIYSIDNKELMFYWNMTSQIINKKEQPKHITFVNQNNTINTEEKINFQDNKLKKYTCIRHNSNEIFTVTVQKNHIIYKKVIDGITHTKKRENVKNFIAGPLIVTFIRDNFEKLSQEKSIQVNIAAPEHLRTLSFDLSIDHIDKTNKKTSIKLSPSNFLISKFVDPIYFIVDTSGSKVFEIIGRIVAVEMINGSKKPIDGHYYFIR